MSNTTDDKKDIVKRDLIKALEQTLGVKTTACRKVGIARNTLYEYMKEDPEFKKAVEDIREISLDFSESMLFENIKDRKEASIFFHLKTQGKHRGYIERQEYEEVNQQPIIIQNASEEFELNAKGDSVKINDDISSDQSDDQTD